MGKENFEIWIEKKKCTQKHTIQIKIRQLFYNYDINPINSYVQTHKKYTFLQTKYLINDLIV